MNPMSTDGMNPYLDRSIDIDFSTDYSFSFADYLLRNNTMVALITQTPGIRATLIASGISRTVVGGDMFQPVMVRRAPEVMALASPSSATGVFELDSQAEIWLSLSLIDSMFQMEKEADLAENLRSMGLDFIKLMSDRIDLISILIEEGRRKPEVQEILTPATQVLIERLSKHFELHIKNGKMRNIDPEIAAITFISYTFYICLMRKFLDGIIGDNEEALEGFIDIFMKGIVQVNSKNLR